MGCERMSLYVCVRVCVCARVCVDVLQAMTSCLWCVLLLVCDKHPHAHEQCTRALEGFTEARYGPPNWWLHAVWFLHGPRHPALPETTGLFTSQTNEWGSAATHRQ